MVGAPPKVGDPPEGYGYGGGPVGPKQPASLPSPSSDLSNRSPGEDLAGGEAPEGRADRLAQERHPCGDWGRGHMRSGRLMVITNILNREK